MEYKDDVTVRWRRRVNPHPVKYSRTAWAFDGAKCFDVTAETTDGIRKPSRSLRFPSWSLRNLSIRLDLGQTFRLIDFQAFDSRNDPFGLNNRLKNHSQTSSTSCQNSDERCTIIILKLRQTVVKTATNTVRQSSSNFLKQLSKQWRTLYDNLPRTSSNSS